jgi:hypothetical protein
MPKTLEAADGGCITAAPENSPALVHKMAQIFGLLDAMSSMAWQ